MAVQLYQSCNEKANVFIAEQFCHWYHILEQCENGVHLSIYFNMHEQKWVYLNGSNKNQLEILRIEDHGVDRGFENLYSEALQTKLEYIRNRTPFL